MANLKSNQGKFFEVIVKMQETQEDGTDKMVKKIIVVDALSFGEAERMATEEMRPYSNGEFDVVNVNPATYGEVFTSYDAKDDKYYKCKLAFITFDEKTQKEKKSKVTYLVQASSTNKAQTYIDNQIMSQTMCDYEICSISDALVYDFIPHL